MSGSGYSSDGGVTPTPGWLADIKQTLKVLFKHIEVRQTPLGVDAPRSIAWASPVPDTYGGQLLTHEADWFPVSLATPSVTHTCDLVTHAELSTNQAMTTVVLAPLAPDNRVGEGLMELMADALRHVEPALPEVEPGAIAVETYTTEAKGSFHPIGITSLKRVPMHFIRKALKWGLRSANAKPLPPIVRKSLPLSSLTERQKYALIKLMAEKAHCKIHEVKLMAVYDRLFVSAYQSMRPTGQGQLLCYPKMPQQIDPVATSSPSSLRSSTMKTGLNPMQSRGTESASESYWLIVGQVNQQPPLPLMTLVTHQQIQALWHAKKGGT